MASKRPVLFVVTSDQHCGSTTGLCPEEGVRVDDDSEYRPSKSQRWAWGKWSGDFWPDVAYRRKHLNADLYMALNGDATEGWHHNTHQVISINPEPQAYITKRAFQDVPVRPTKVFVVRGTEVHVGPGGSSEEALAKQLKAERNPETRTWSWWHLYLEIHGVLIDLQHHGRTGTRPWTKTSGPGALALEIFYEHTKHGRRPPNLSFRSHRHTYVDSYDAHPTRLIQTPAWQLKTAHAHKVVPESIADIGGIITTIYPDGRYEVIPKLYCPDPTPIWKAA